MPSESARVAARLRAAFGPLYATLVSEAPEREAWTRLGLAQVEEAMGRARERVGDPGHALGFRTLLKQELDAVCDLTPPVMSFEAPSLPPDRTVLRREARRDERARERERQAELRRDELRAQARRLLTDDDPPDR
jgi:hypothetical protein